MAFLKYINYESDNFENYKLKTAIGIPSSSLLSTCNFNQVETFFSKKFLYEKPLLIDESILDFIFRKKIKFDEKSVKLCPNCGEDLRQRYLFDDFLYLGIKCENRYANYQTFLKYADDLGVLKVFIDGVGFVDTLDKKVLFYFEELANYENAYFVVNRFSGDFKELVKLSSNKASNNIVVFSLDKLTNISFLVEVEFFCNRCSCAYDLSNRLIFSENDLISLNSYLFKKAKNLSFTLKRLREDTIDSLYAFFQENIDSLSEQGRTLLEIIKFLHIIGLESLNFSQKINQLSVQEFYFLSLYLDSSFDNNNTAYLYKFPIFEEFDKKVIKTLKEKKTIDIRSFEDYRVFDNLKKNPTIFKSDRAFESNLNSLLTDLSNNSSKVFLIDDLVPTSFLPKIIDNFTENKIIHFDALEIFENLKKERNSSIYTYFRLSDYFSKIYASHPLSLSRGYGNAEFLHTKSKFLCNICLGSGFLANKTICSSCKGRRFSHILEPIRWKGFSIGDLMVEPIANVIFEFSNLIPELREVFSYIELAELEDKSLGDSISNLSPIQKFYSHIIKYRFQELTGGDILFIESIESFLKNPSFSIFFDKLLDDLVYNECRIIIRTCK